MQRPEDVAEVKKIARPREVMAKLEKPQAIERLEEIMELSDALMVARGDLGVELPLEVVPGLQKRYHPHGAASVGKPVVVATQMLESMIVSPTVRAEVSTSRPASSKARDEDAVMLSAESAAGKFVFEAVETMRSRSSRRWNAIRNYPVLLAGQRSPVSRPAPDAIAAAARSVAETLDLKAIVAWTASGANGPANRPRTSLSPILALTTSRNTARRLALVWGVHAVWVKTRRTWMTWPMPGHACAREQEFANPGQRIILVAGVPFGTPGATNMLRITFVSADD